MGKSGNGTNGKKMTAEAVDEHRHDWVCDADGKVYDADKKLKAPAIKIATVERLSAATKAPMKWRAEVHELDAKGAWQLVHPKDGPGSYYKKQKSAFDAAFTVAKAHLHHGYLKALREQSADLPGIKRLLARLKDEARLEAKAISDRTIVRLRMLEGDDLLLAEQVLATEFPQIAENLVVLFLFRQQGKGRTMGEWTSGKDARGKKLVRWGQCKKASPAEADIWRAAFGAAPDFIVTFDEGCWGRAKAAGNVERCKFIVRHELCHIGINAEKGSTWVVAHDIEEFTRAVTSSKPAALLPSRLSFLKHAVRHFEDAKQMNLLEMLGDDAQQIETGSSPVTARNAAVVAV